MAALLHCIVVDIENSRLKDHIRDWNTNMKVDMYDKMKELLKTKKKQRADLLDSVFDMIESENLYDWVICEECECFIYRHGEGHRILDMDDGLYICKDCIEKNPDLEFSDDEEE